MLFLPDSRSIQSRGYSFRNTGGQGPSVLTPEPPSARVSDSPGKAHRDLRPRGTDRESFRKKLSIIILTFNEEANIREVLECTAFADEILVVDSCSTDRTRQLAEQYDVVFIQRKFDNFLDQRLFAASQATHDMILFLDADERISDALREELLVVLGSVKVLAGYKVPFRHHFMGRFMRENNFRESWKLRLMDRTRCHYRKEVLVHEQGVVCEGRAGKLRSPVWHYTYASWEQYIRKKDQYARLKAQEYYRNGVRPTLYHFTVKPLWRFLHQYLVRGGFLDGFPGLISAAVNAHYTMIRYTRLWLLRQGINAQPGNLPAQAHGTCQD